MEKSLEVSYVGCFTLSNILTFFLEPFILLLMRVVMLEKYITFVRRQNIQTKKQKDLQPLKALHLKWSMRVFENC